MPWPILQVKNCETTVKHDEAGKQFHLENTWNEHLDTFRLYPERLKWISPSVACNILQSFIGPCNVWSSWHHPNLSLWPPDRRSSSAAWLCWDPRPISALLKGFFWCWGFTWASARNPLWLPKKDSRRSAARGLHVLKCCLYRAITGFTCVHCHRMRYIQIKDTIEDRICCMEFRHLSANLKIILL